LARWDRQAGTVERVDLLLALAAAIGTAAALLGLVALLRRWVRLLGLLAFPLTIGAIAVGVWVYVRLKPEHQGQLDALFFWLVVFFLAASVLRVLGLYYFEIYLQARRGLRLPPLLVGVSFLVAYLVVALLIFRVAFPEVGIAPLLATSAVTSLVLGLALQPILGNFFAGLVLAVERPFRINDWIKVNGIDGRVVEITWRTTHVRTRDNDNLILPNGKIAELEVLNYFYPQPLHMERIMVGVHYRTPPHRVERAVLEACSRVEGLVENPSSHVFMHSFDESAIVYEVRVWTEDILGLPRIRHQVHREIWEEFRRRDITIPFPIRTLEIEPRARTVEVVNAAQPTLQAATASLWVAEGPDRGKAIVLLDGKPAMIGRAQHCDLTLSEQQASREHFRLELDGAGYVLQDLESKIGTVVNGERVQRRSLRDLDRIAIGETVLIFEHHV
jgi:small-conductance mechanosensitive channel